MIQNSTRSLIRAQVFSASENTQFSQKPSGIRYMVLGVSLMCIAAFTASVLIKTFSKPEVSYEFLQDHIELTYTPIAHVWKAPKSGAERGRSLSSTDHTFMSRVLMAIERGQKIWAGQDIVEGQALNAFNARIQDWEVCQKDETTNAPCRLTLRIDRVLTPRHVHGDLRVANIEERSQRLDLITTASKDKNTSEIKIDKISSEVRNLRFVKRRNGWALRTIDTLVSDTQLQSLSPVLPMQNFVGINYYPATSSWRDFWTEFPKDTIHRDLALIKDLGGNSLRIFLTHNAFTQVESQDEAKRRLVEFMDIAQAHGLKVMPTFFDLRPDYRIENWAADVAFLKMILPLIEDHPALLAIDLKNQIDLDIPIYGAGLIESWIAVMHHAVRTTFPNIPVTVGFSNAKVAIAHGQGLDIMSYHDYEPIGGFSTRLSNVRAAYPDRPVWITELGSTVWAPLPILGPSVKKQAARLSTQLGAASKADGIFLWTLNDFDHVGTDIVGWQPWRKKQQAHYGLYDLEGVARPSAQIFSDYAQKQTRVNSGSNLSASHSVHTSLKGPIR